MSRTDELQSYRISIIGLMAITNRLLRADVPKRQKRPDLPWSETERLIDEWIHSESDRKLLKEKLHNEDVHLIKELSGGMKNIKTIIAMDEAEDDYRTSEARRGGRRTSGDYWGESRREPYMLSERRGGYSRDGGTNHIMEKLEEVKMAVRNMED